jgi:hypothetical protein
MAAASASNGRLAVGRRLVYSLLPLAVLIAASEVLLSLFLPRHTAEVLHASRGFDPEARYIVSDPEHPGGWLTQIHGEAEREVVVPKRGEARRVLLMGGSNVRGFPERELERLLDAATIKAAVDWEVINLGRAGYGSLRVLHLFEQALEMDPDVVVIYTGHNEFIERGFAAELGGQTSVAAEWLSGLRSFELLGQALKDEFPPTDLDRLDPAQRELPWSQTLEVYERYARNLELMCEIAARQQLPVLLCTVVSNMVWLPRVWTPSEPLSDELAGRHLDLVNESYRFIPQRYRKTLRPPVRLRAVSWVSEGNQRTGDALPRLRELKGPLSPQQRRRKDESLPVELWTDPGLWNPLVPEVLDWYAGVVFPTLSESEQPQVRHAAALLMEALRIVPDDPHALYLLGLLGLVTGSREEGVQLLRQAASFDRSPNNANDRSNDIVRALSERQAGVTLFDAVRVFRSRCPDDLVGYEVMMDACHLHPGARDVLMMDLARELLRMQLH